MAMTFSADSQWLSMALEVVQAAQKRMSIHEFDRRAILLPHIAGASYIDRMRVLEKLIQDRIVGLDNKILVLGSIDDVGWILDGLRFGSEQTWAIAEVIDRRERMLGKFNAENQAEIGRIGEEAVMEQLRKTVPDDQLSKLRQVSLFDDSLGYDIVSPSISGQNQIQLIEVKTSVRPGDKFSFFISRNEFRVGSNNSNWKLVCVQIVEGSAKILGHFSIEQILDRFPNEIDDDVKWESCSVIISRAMLTRGLP